MEFNQERPYGIEIEGVGCDRYALNAALNSAGIQAQVAGYGHADVDHWKVSTDSSVHGRLPFELVSPKLYGQAGLDEIKRVLRIVREQGGRVNASCGLHVHHSAQGMTGKQMRMVAHFYSALFQCFKTIFSLSRHNSQWCRLADAREVNRRSDSAGHHNRYEAVNLAAFFRHGTVEFRQHQGTVNTTKIISWIVFTQQFMLGAMRSKKAVSWRTKDFRTGLFNFWRLYDKNATLDNASENMLRFIAKKTGWKVGKMISACHRRQAEQQIRENNEQEVFEFSPDPSPAPERGTDGRELCPCRACVEDRAERAAAAAEAN